MKKKCKKCYKWVDKEHLIVPVKDISFLTINLRFAFDLLDRDKVKLSDHEKNTMNELWEIYAPKIHYWSVGRFYNMPKRKHKKFKYKHNSYM